MQTDKNDKNYEMLNWMDSDWQNNSWNFTGPD